MDTDVRLHGIPSMTALLSRRDIAVLAAILAGRCTLSGPDGRLVVDGMSCCHQFVGRRLARAGLIDVPTAGAVRLTARGLAALRAV